MRNIINIVFPITNRTCLAIIMAQLFPGPCLKKNIRYHWCLHVLYLSALIFIVERFEIFFYKWKAIYECNVLFKLHAMRMCKLI